MNIIDELITNSELELEKSNNSSCIVGNRPHYPMLVLNNGGATGVEYELISSKLRRVWSQSMRYIISYSYSLNGESVVFNSVSDNSIQPIETVFSKIDESKKASDVFASMSQWCVYNVIDTSNIKSLNEFVAQYKIYNSIKKIVFDAYKSMLIVLLNDSSSCREIANSIREYMSHETHYDSTIIVSNRARNNSMCDMEELYRIVANILILSNNDAVSTFDDIDYKKRVSILYSDTPYIVSYTLRERPNKKIAIQIYDVILEELIKEINDRKKIEFAQWQKRLHFENSSSPICENFLKTIRINVDSSAFLYLPFKNSTDLTKVNFARARYSDIKSLIYEEAFKCFVSRYCAEQVVKDIDLDQCINLFRDSVFQEFTSVELSTLTDDIIERLIGQLSVGTLNDDLSIDEYFIRFVKAYIRKELLYPRFINVLKELRDSSIENICAISNINDVFKEHIPLSLGDIGNIYKTRAKNFFQSAQGDKNKKRIFSPSNVGSNLMDHLLNNFKDIIKANQDLFKLQFINTWAMQLDLAGEQVYRMISKAITEDADGNIRLYGNYPIDERLKVLMLHTGDGNGENETELYKYLKTMFKDDPIVQYFNTGNDDSLEALYFVACSGNNLQV